VETKVGGVKTKIKIVNNFVIYPLPAYVNLKQNLNGGD
jgi:hypothetical protein